MTHKSFYSILLAITLSLLSLFCIYPQSIKADTTGYFTFIVLNHYSMDFSIGDENYLIAITSNGKKPSFKSSNSSIASVNTYGLITAKKAGTCKIIAKTTNAEAYCIVKVYPTIIKLDKTSVSLENGNKVQVLAEVSPDHPVKWKSSKSSIASVDDSGLVTAKKPGNADITACVDGSKSICHIKVKSPTIKLNKTKLNLYRTQTDKLTVSVSSNIKPTWKSSKNSVATVDNYGNITAVKHGTASIQCTVDGVTKECIVTVRQPEIKLSDSEITLTCGDSYTLAANVSSGNIPQWSSSNINIATVDENGNIQARQKGKAYIYAKEDGINVSCIVKVIDP